MKRPTFGIGAFMARRISRRLFAGRLGLALLTAFSIPEGVTRLAWAHQSIFDGMLAELFPYPDSVRTVGAAYMSDDAPTGQAQWQHDIERLLATIGRRQTYAHLRRCIDNDFRNLAIVTVDGWVLSETEARLCAATAMRWAV